MVKRQPKRGISQNSRGSEDKLMACLNPGVNVGGTYMQAPKLPRRPRAVWHAELTPDQRETVLVVIDAYTHARRDAAEEIAESLPSAPKSPL